MRKPCRRRSGAEHAKRVLAALQQASRPLSAYEIMAVIGDGTRIAPMTVYRALDRLVSERQAYRLESLNAFVACGPPGGDGPPVFAICDACGSVSAFAAHELMGNLAEWCRSSEFEISAATLELHGKCHSCQLRQAN